MYTLRPNIWLINGNLCVFIYIYSIYICVCVYIVYVCVYKYTYTHTHICKHTHTNLKIMNVKIPTSFYGQSLPEVFHTEYTE